MHEDSSPEVYRLPVVKTDLADQLLATARDAEQPYFRSLAGIVEDANAVMFKTALQVVFEQTKDLSKEEGEKAFQVGFNAIVFVHELLSQQAEHDSHGEGIA